MIDTEYNGKVYPALLFYKGNTYILDYAQISPTQPWFPDPVVNAFAKKQYSGYGTMKWEYGNVQMLGTYSNVPVVEYNNYLYVQIGIYQFQSVQPITQPIQTPITEPITQPISQPITQPITQPIIQPITEPITQPISQPVQATTTTTQPDYTKYVPYLIIGIPAAIAGYLLLKKRRR